MSNLGDLQCVAGEYISPAATSVPPLEPVPALPVELVLLRSFFSFFLTSVSPVLPVFFVSFCVFCGLHELRVVESTVYCLYVQLIKG